MRCVLYVTKLNLLQLVKYRNLAYSEHEQKIFIIWLYISIFNHSIAQLQSFTMSTVLKTVTYLKFCYIKVKMRNKKKEYIITKKVKFCT